MMTRATRHAVEKRDVQAHLFSGPHDPPLFGGVALVLAFLPRPKRKGRFKVANHSEMR